MCVCCVIVDMFDMKMNQGCVCGGRWMLMLACRGKWDVGLG